MANGLYGRLVFVLLAFAPCISCRNSGHDQRAKVETPVAMSAPQPNLAPRSDDASHGATFGHPPALAAVIVNNESGSVIAVADIEKGEVRPLDGLELSPVPRVPLWSPDGQRLVFRVDDVLMSWTSGKSPARLIQGLAVDAVTPYAFSPDSASLAVALQDSVAVLRFATSPTHGPGSKSSLPPGCRPVDLLWSADGNQLLALCKSDDAAQIPQMLRFDRMGGHTFRTGVRDIARLLGWRAGAVLASRSTPSGDEVGTVSVTGEFLRLRTGEHGEAVVRYASAPGLLVLQKPGEDLGDAVILHVAPPDQLGARPWLEKFPALTDLAFSSDGRWAMFANRKGFPSDERGGSLYLAPVGTGEARLVLRGKPGTLSYSFPTPQ